ncbi:ATP-binding cassette domain-containing protein [Altererythrobacter lutimaris]|uniref:ABC transporter ATP-binding protein n=1 Tax=Altererythrobacter lutimaris TaxID=2743979 RepID=A0A850HEZ2_9SPHN|nr:ABC transporter ATP-binding protein [Altererythrobacter lutimaris]NVE95716.1 ABC transporter ATP-binding protein [Altererythrobacter lutimaris]
MSGSDVNLESSEARHALSHGDALRFILGYVGPGHLALLGALLVLTSLSEGLGLLLLVPVTQLIVGIDATNLEPAWLGDWANVPPAVLLAGVVALICARAALVYVTNYLRTEIDLSFTRDLRRDAHRALVRAEWRWLAGRHSADHEALLLGEANRAGMLLDQALFLASATITLLVLIAAALLISPDLTLGVLAIAAIFALPFLILKGRTARDAESYADAYAGLHREVSGGLAHLRSARIAGAGSVMEQRFSDASEQVRTTELRYVRHGFMLVAIVQAVAAALLAGMVYFALIRGDVALSIFVPLLALLARSAPLAGAILQGIRQWRHAQPALARLRGLIEEARGHAEVEFVGAGSRPIQLERSIELKDVTLKFEGREAPVFHAFSASIAANSVTAITGPSGSGKSSLADIVSGLIEPDGGTVSVDDTPLVGQARLQWRAQVAYAEQAPFLFAGSIAENIAWAAPDTSFHEVQSALDAASADFIDRLPEGVNSAVQEEGRGFSGGEKQRLALARALLRKPQLLILDEVTASLDQSNKDAIIQSIEMMRSKCTILILTHDEQFAALADNVIDLSGLADESNG